MSLDSTDRGLIKITAEFIPTVMKLQRKWVGWIQVYGADGRRIKKPFNIQTGRVDGQEACRVDWHEVDRAYKAGTISGYGYSLGERGTNDDVVFIDLDNAVEVTDGENGNVIHSIKPWACDILDRFEGAYIELSPSGTGVHIIVMGTVPHSISRVKNHEGVEIYDSGRYLAMTGYMPEQLRELVSSELLDKQESLTWLYDRTEAAIRKTKRATPAPTIAYTGEYGDDFEYATKILMDGWLDNRVEDYGVWLEVGFALHERFGAAGIDLWDTWSQRGMNYETGCCHSKARTFGAGSSRGKAKFGSFVTWVRQAGGPPQRPPAAPKARMLPASGVTIYNGAGAGAEQSVDAGAGATEEPPEESDDGERDMESRIISVDGKDMANMSGWLYDVERHLGRAKIYRYQGTLARIKPAADGLSLPSVQKYDANSLAADISNCVGFDQYIVKAKRRIECPPRVEHMKLVLSMSDWPRTPRLEMVASGPFLRPDGTICTKNGYDTQSGIFLQYNGKPVVVPDQPTEQQVVEAFELLLELTSQFEWSIPKDHEPRHVTPSQAAYVAHFLTLLARPAINGAVPAFVFSASSKGAGKTTLAQLSPLIAYGVEPALTPCPNQTGNNDELKKLLLSLAVSDTKSVIFDNWTTGQSVGGSALDLVITSTRIIDRPLGITGTVDAPWRAVVAITGNSLSLKSDFADRAIWASLRPTVENPRSRVPEGGFHHENLKGYAVEHRSEYLAAGLTILRAHMLSDCYASGVVNCGSFDDWGRIVRNAVKNGTGVDVKTNGAVSSVQDVDDDELHKLHDGLIGFQEATGLNGGAPAVGEGFI